MRLSVLGASFFFCGVFAVAGALAACASGEQVPSGPTGPTGPTGPEQTYDASVDDAGTGPTEEDSSSPGYGDGPTSPPPGEDAEVDAGEDAGADAAPAVGPTCTAGQTCVDAVPSGWTGYVQLLLANGDAGSACASPYAMPQAALTGPTNVDGGPAVCGSCTCGVPEAGPIQCSMNLPGGACPGSMATNVPQGMCVNNPSTYFPNGAGTPPTVAPNAGPCGPGQGGAVTTPPPPPTSTLATVCGSASDDAGAPPSDAGAGDSGGTMTCMPSQACAAVPGVMQGDSGSPSGPCIYQMGVQDCPTGVAFTAQFVVGPIEDTRGCACNCGLPTCPSDGYVQGYPNTGCTGTVDTTITSSSTCQIFGISSKSYMFFPTHGTWTGACEPDDAGPTGSVTIDAGAATTFCCIP